MYTIQQYDRDAGWVNHPSTCNSLKHADRNIIQLSTEHSVPRAHYRIIPTDLEVQLIPPAADYHHFPPTEYERLSDQAVLDKLKIDAAALNKPDMNKELNKELNKDMNIDRRTTRNTDVPMLNKPLKRERRRERYGENYVITSNSPKASPVG